MNIYEERIKILEKKIRKQSMNFKVKLELAKLYEEVGDYIEALKIYSFLEPIKVKKVSLIEDTVRCLHKLQKKNKNGLKKGLEAISYISSPLNSFPIYWRFYFDKNGKLTYKKEFFIYKFLNKENEEYNPFICAFNEGYHGIRYKTYELLSKSYNGKMHFNVKAEIIPSKLSRREFYKIDLVSKVLPIACTKENQEIQFNFNNIQKKKILQPFEFSYIRIDEDVEISSKNTMILGNPIKLLKEPKRKKLVIDIFVDTLSFDYIKSYNYKHCTEIYKFFNKGAIFTNNYSIGEYTRPVVSGMKTGLYTYKCQMFNDKLNTKISRDVFMIAELFKESGYFTAEFSGDTGQPAGELLRGIDRAVVQCGHYYKASDIVNDAIDHIEAFKECSNYIRLSILDIHRAIEEDIHRNISTQVTTPFKNIFTKSEGSNSVFMKESVERITDYKNSIIKVDRALGCLFRYLEENYTEKDYFVTLVSDHGAMLLDTEEFLLKKMHTNTALMARGSEVGDLGIINNEVTSVIDLYSILNEGLLLKEKNITNDSRLPKVFGGLGREYSVSESLYPGQTFKICIRDLSYEFRLETKNNTSYDGIVDLREYKCNLFDISSGSEILNEDIKNKFINIVKRHTKEYKK